MMTSADKAEKAREILNSKPSEEDITIAVGLAQEAAADGDPDGLYLMARLYHEGDGVELDHEKAFDFSQRALAAGNEKVKTLLAIYYIVGNVVERNLPLAEQYLRDGMEKNDGFAYFVMGDFVFQNAFPDIEWTTFPDYFVKSYDAGETVALIRLAEKYNNLCEPEQAEYWYGKAEEAGVQGVVESRAQFTEDNYPERRQNAVNIYIQNGMYDKAFALAHRDAAMGDTIALFLLAGFYTQGLGEEAYGRDVQKALQIYERLAAEGESHANYALGFMYCTVEEIKDNQKALEYTQRAAEADHLGAQCALGKLYVKGEIVDKDMTKAAEWIEKAAAQGEAEALFVLAASCLQDPEIDAVSEYALDYDRDEKRGFELLQQAAEAGSADALFCLYWCYRKGKYMVQDYELAFFTLCRSNQIKLTPNKVRLMGDAYRDGEGVAQDYKEAVACYEWAMGNDDITAIANLSQMYQEGKGVEKDQRKANALMSHLLEIVRWQNDGVMPLAVVQDKAAQGDPIAMYQLGNRYHEGDGVEQDMKKAVEWWQKAHEAGNIGGTHNLGCYYLQEGEEEKGIRYLTQSGATGYSQSYHALGEYYLWHVKEEDNIQKGISNLTTAAEQGYAPSQWDLAGIYHDGQFVPKDYDKARYWLDKCLASDYPAAHYCMGMSLVNGDMYEQDYAKALEHLRTAVAYGVHDADAPYISLRWNGNGVEADREEVVKVFTTLADSNDAIALWQLYMLYIDESYENHDTAKAIDYLKLSASQGYTDALAQLAWHYYWGEGVEKDVRLAINLYTSAAEAGSLGAAVKLARSYITGEEGVVESDYDKAIDLLQPHLESGLGEVYYLMAYAVRGKCDMKNAYSWEQAEQSFQYMQKAAKAGYVDAMHDLAYYLMEGYGVFSYDTKETKEWLHKYIDNGGKVTDEEKEALQSDEEWDEYARNEWYKCLILMVDANIERIENPLKMFTDENNINVENICLNAAQLGECNALVALGVWGMDILKEDTKKAKVFISAACQGGFPYYSYHAGKQWLEEGLDDKEAVEHAADYFMMGINVGSVDCCLEMGLLLTDSHFEKHWGAGKRINAGKQYLQAVANVEGDDFEEQRQQACVRLTELDQLPQSAWNKIKKGLSSIFGND